MFVSKKKEQIIVLHYLRKSVVCNSIISLKIITIIITKGIFS